MSNEEGRKQVTGSSNTESARTGPASHEPYDAIVIGAGLCGIIFLAYARKNGLRCIVLEKQDDVGGLWYRLPTWQDLQDRQQDIALDGVPLDGVDQPAVHQYVREWVRRFELDPDIRLGREVTGVSWQDGGWTVHTKRGEEFRTNYLMAASGVQNEPWMPEVKRSNSEIVESHSFDLRRPEGLSDQRVTVVGGGASSQDLLDLAFEHGAKDVHWVYRKDVRWFLPTKRAKHRAWPNLRELAVGQSLQGTGGVNVLMRWYLRTTYALSGVSVLAPDEPFDFDRDQLIPGRATLLRNMKSVTRHQAEVRSMQRHELTLSNNERFETDRVLWGTGYIMNLSYLGLPEYDRVRKPTELLPKLGSLVRSQDYPNLFFLGMTLISSSSSTPFFAAVEAKTIISHMQGKCEIPEQALSHHLTHWDLVRYFATFDRANYPRSWKTKLLWLSLWYEALHNRSVRVGFEAHDAVANTRRLAEAA